jgi:hypothetical protein
MIISFGVWLELNMRTHLDTAASPYVFAFTEDTMILSGRQKAKDMAQTIFGQGIFRRPEFQAWGSWEVIQSGSLLQVTFTIAEFQSTTRTLEAIGSGRAEFQNVMTTWNRCSTLIAKLLKSCVLVVLAII